MKTGRVCVKNGRRLLCMDTEGHYFVCSGRAKEGEAIIVNEKSCIAVPSFLFGIALMNESDPDVAVEQMYNNYHKGWEF